MGIVSQLFYGPNVALALLGGAGALAMFLVLFASAPAAEVRRKVTGEEEHRTSLQHRIEQANLPITAGEFVRTGAMLAVATTILAYWGYLGGKRDKIRRAYQEALARVTTIVRDIIGRGGGRGWCRRISRERAPRWPRANRWRRRWSPWAGDDAILS